jgi:hypothetical protein
MGQVWGSQGPAGKEVWCASHRLGQTTNYSAPSGEPHRARPKRQRSVGACAAGRDVVLSIMCGAVRVASGSAAHMCCDGGSAAGCCWLLLAAAVCGIVPHVSCLKPLSGQAGTREATAHGSRDVDSPGGGCEHRDVRFSCPTTDAARCLRRRETRAHTGDRQAGIWESAELPSGHDHTPGKGGRAAAGLWRPCPCFTGDCSLFASRPILAHSQFIHDKRTSKKYGVSRIEQR